jgi:hypothetical protein
MSMLPHAAAAAGELAIRDFRIFAYSITECQRLGGLFLNVGSAVHGPEVFLKALSMAKNVLEPASQKPMITAVFDIGARRKGWEEDDSKAAYYSRPFKTILHRAVEGSPRGRGLYVQGDHIDTIPNLYRLLNSYKS